MKPLIIFICLVLVSCAFTRPYYKQVQHDILDCAERFCEIGLTRVDAQELCTDTLTTRYTRGDIKKEIVKNK